MICQNEIQITALNELERKIEIVPKDFTNEIETKSKSETSNDIMKISGIYKIINKVNGKYYVGSSSQLNVQYGRWYKHKRDLTKGVHINSHLQFAWNKYGPDAFDFVIVEETAREKMEETEQKYLDIAKEEKDKCYNQNFLVSGTNFRPEIIKKRTESMKRFYLNNPNPQIGRKQSEATKEKIRRKAIGRSPINKDTKSYTFVFIKTNELFTGTKEELAKKINASAVGVGALVRKSNISFKGWALYPLSEETKNRIPSFRKRDPITKQFTPLAAAK